MNKTFNSILKKKWNWNLIIPLIGVVAAWIPFLFDHFSPTILNGKILSLYDNIGTKSLYVFKLSVISMNNSFSLKDIDVNIEYQHSGWTYNQSLSQRNIYFTLEGNLFRLNVPQQEFLNHLSILKKDEPTVGYIFVETPLIKEKIINVKFIFKSFDSKTKILSFNEDNIGNNKLYFDDTIWESVDSLKRKELFKKFLHR